MLKFHKMQEHYSVEWQNDVWETERIGGIYKSGRGRNRKLIESGRERGASRGPNRIGRGSIGTRTWQERIDRAQSAENRGVSWHKLGKNGTRTGQRTGESGHDRGAVGKEREKNGGNQKICQPRRLIFGNFSQFLSDSSRFINNYIIGCME